MGFARKVYSLGVFGNGSRMKFVANHLVAIHNVASAEAMVLGMKAGLDAHQIVEVIGAGVGASKIFDLRAPMMADNRYTPATMKCDIWQKDMSIIGTFAESVGAPVPVFRSTKPIYDAGISDGHGEEDTAAVVATRKPTASHRVWPTASRTCRCRKGRRGACAGNWLGACACLISGRPIESERMRLPRIIGGGLGLGVIGLMGFYILTIPPTLSPADFKPRTSSVANGQTVFNAGGCANCHATPGQDDRLKLGGGLGIASPFGEFKVPNISSDPKFGIGSWTEGQFVNAIMRGVGRSGEHLFPALPYTSYQRMTLDDARDLYAYMKTLPADARPSEPHGVPFPFNIRRSLGVWKLLFLDNKPFVPDPQSDAATNRGGYLIEALGHCAECHSGRNVLGGIKAGTRFAGGALPDGKGWVPNITPHAEGLATWSVADMEFLLLNGLTPDGASVAGEMAAVVRSTAQLSAADRHAMALYLKSLPPRPGKKPPGK